MIKLMKISELIEKLKTYNPNHTICGCNCGEHLLVINEKNDLEEEIKI